MTCRTHLNSKKLTIILVCITISWTIFCIGFLSRAALVRNNRNIQEKILDENFYSEQISNTIPSIQYVVTRDMTTLKTSIIMRNEEWKSQEWTTLKSRLNSRNNEHRGHNNTPTIVMTTYSVRNKNQESLMSNMTSETKHVKCNETFNGIEGKSSLNKSQSIEVKVFKDHARYIDATTSKTTYSIENKNQERLRGFTTTKTDHVIWKKFYDKKDKTSLNKSELSEMKVNSTENPWCQEAYKFYPLSINFTQFIKDPSKFYVFPINKHPFDFILNPIRVCSIGREVFILSVVKSRIDNFFLRSAIRATWGKEAKKGNNRLVFLLGYSTDTKVMEVVHQEFVKYDDMIMEDFIDEYFNTTRKFIMAARWIPKYCSNARFVFLVDEDIMVNFANLVAFFCNVSMTEEETLFEGELHYNDKPHRYNISKWYITREEYPFDCYLPFVSGGAILTSGIVVRKLNIAIPYVQILKFDDVFLAIVAHKIGVHPRNNEQVCIDSCGFDLKNYITRHGFSQHQHYFRFGKRLNSNKKPKRP